MLLHGRGADEHDLLPLLEALDPERRLVGVTPRGPLSLPPGGAHWYVVRSIGFPDSGTFHETYDRLSSWFDALPERTGVPIERTVIGGFSQGAVMSYALGLGQRSPGAGRDHRAVRVHPDGRRALARPRESTRPAGRDRTRHARSGHRHRVRARRARPSHRRGARRAVPRVADVAHDRHRLPRRAARLARSPAFPPRRLDAARAVDAPRRRAPRALRTRDGGRGRSDPRRARVHRLRAGDHRARSSASVPSLAEHADVVAIAPPGLVADIAGALQPDGRREAARRPRWRPRDRRGQGDRCSRARGASRRGCRDPHDAVGRRADADPPDAARAPPGSAYGRRS